MKKTLDSKKVNRAVKRLNRQLAEDVFKDRFWLRQCEKCRGEDGMEYFRYELRDREQPDRNQEIRGWFSAFEITRLHALYSPMNNFIISSDFWQKYNKKEA